MFSSLQQLIVLLLCVAVFASQVWALIDVAPRAARGFTAEGKQTKTRWLVILVVCALFGFISLPYPIGIGGLSFFVVLSAVPPIVYFVDVRPAILAYGRGKGGSRGTGSRGGW